MTFLFNDYAKDCFALFINILITTVILDIPHMLKNESPGMPYFRGQ
jgi:hypothetical protein